MPVLDLQILGRDDVLEVLYELTDLAGDIYEIVSLYAESVLALLDTVSDPAAAHSSIGVSEAEHARIAGAFLLLLIYKQADMGHGQRWDFLSVIPLWQLERLISVDVFLKGTLHSEVGERRSTSSPLYGLVEKKYRAVRRRCDASAFTWWCYECRVCGAYPFADLAREASIRFGLVDHYFISTKDAFVIDGMMMEDGGGKSGVEEMEASYGWTVLRSIAGDTDIVDRYGEIFIKLGLLFWDEDRFSHIPLTCMSDYEALVGTFEEARYAANVMAYDVPEVDDDGYVGSVRRERILCTDEIVQWTRSGAQCTFGEWKVSRSLQRDAR